MIYSVYFSPTGGTKKVSDMVLSAWSEKNTEVAQIDLCEPKDFSKYTFEKNDTVIVSVPSYGGRVPEIAVKRLQEMTGHGARAALIAVYGNRAYDDTLLELKNVLRARGFVPWAAIAAVAKHSVVNEIAADRPDRADEKELGAFGKRIKESLLREWNGDGSQAELSVKGNAPYREYHGIPLKPKTGNKCTGCGLCALKCPVKAISKENPRLMDKEKCISCMRCIQICPNQARKVNGLMLRIAGSGLKKKCAGRKENSCVIVK